MKEDWQFHLLLLPEHVHQLFALFFSGRVFYVRQIFHLLGYYEATHLFFGNEIQIGVLFFLLGLQYMDSAGYDLNGMIKAFEVSKKESKGVKGPLILRTHPYIDDRISTIKKEIEKINSDNET